MTYSKTTENQHTTCSHVNTCYFQLKLLQSLLMIICSAQFSIGGLLQSICVALLMKNSKASLLQGKRWSPAVFWEHVRL